MTINRSGTTYARMDAVEFDAHDVGRFAVERQRVWHRRTVLGEPPPWTEDEALRRFHFCLALDTPVPTPSGWTTMGDISEGDVVFDPTGQPVRVLSTTPVYTGRSCFEVTFSDGTSIVADGEHRWETYYKANKRGVHKIRTTTEVASSISLPYARSAHSVRTTKPLNLPHAELPIDPYVLGYWLGDGTAASTAITVASCDLPNLLSALDAAGYDERTVSDNGNVRVVYVKNIRHIFVEAGLLDNKHVPRAYLRASVDQRLELLRGLMDSDGTFIGNCSFTNTNAALVDGLVELVRSLGAAPHVRRYEHHGGFANARDQYVVCFAALRHACPFRLARKAQAHQSYVRGRTLRSGHRNITSVTPTRSVPVRCITVDSDAGLFLAGEGMVVTGNCNVQRDLDRGTIYLQEVLSRTLDGYPDREKLLNVAMYRQLNRRDVWDRHVGWVPPDEGQVRELCARLGRVRAGGESIGPVAWMPSFGTTEGCLLDVGLGTLAHLDELDALCRAGGSLEPVHRFLKKNVKRLGGMCGFQVCLDLTYVYPGLSEDEWVFLYGGHEDTGSHWTARRLHPELSTLDCCRLLRDTQDEWLMAHGWPGVAWAGKPRLTLADVEHVLCEFRKWTRASLARSAKRKYRYATGEAA